MPLWLRRIWSSGHHPFLGASLNGMAKAVTALEGEMKTQKSDMKLAIKTMDRLARAQEDMVKQVPMLSGKS